MDPATTRKTISHVTFKAHTSTDIHKAVFGGDSFRVRRNRKHLAQRLSRTCKHVIWDSLERTRTNLQRCDKLCCARVHVLQRVPCSNTAPRSMHNCAHDKTNQHKATIVSMSPTL